MKKCESVPSCPWRVGKCSTLPMEVMEVFHAACGGHGSVVKGLEVFHTARRGGGGVPSCPWRAWECSTLPVEGVEVFHAARARRGSVPR